MSLNLMNYLPRFYNGVTEMEAVQDTNGFALSELKQHTNDIINQLFISSATWGLEMWEEFFDIPIDRSISYQARRKKVLSRVRGFGTLTKERTLALFNVFSNGRKAYLKEEFSDYIIKSVYEVDDLIDFTGLLYTFKEVKPAHLCHVVELIAKTQFADILAKILIVVSTKLTQPYLFNDSSTVRIYQHAGYLGVSQTTTENMNILTMNGMWKLDGTFKLNGINVLGERLYLSGADRLRIRVYQNSTLVEDITV